MNPNKKFLNTFIDKNIDLAAVITQLIHQVSFIKEVQVEAILKISSSKFEELLKKKCNAILLWI